MTPFILNIEEDKEDADDHRDDDADHDHQATVHQAAGPQVLRFSWKHFCFALHNKLWLSCTKFSANISKL